MPIELAAIGIQRDFVLARLEREFVVHRVWDAPDKVAALRPVAERIRGVLSHGMAGLPTGVIEALPNLEICSLNGVGLETTDLALARRRGIVVTTAPVLYDDVADLALLLGLAACRRLVEADRYVRAGRWQQGRMGPAHKFTGRRAGILGLGRIGMNVAKRLEGFGTLIGYYDPQPKPGVPYQAYDSARALAEASDLLFLCAAGSHGGGPIVTAEILDALGPDGVLVNVARGWLVDEGALVEALGEGRLGAAGLDVFADEPNVPETLLGLDNVVLTPHVASNTHETLRAMGQNVLDNMLSWFGGQGAVTPVP